MVTSFRPRSPYARDDTVLTTVRPVSDLRELYHQYTAYRLEMLEERIRTQLRDLAGARAACRTVSPAALQAFIAEQRAFLAAMARDIVDEDRVLVGALHESHLLKKGQDGSPQRPDKDAVVWEDLEGGKAQAKIEEHVAKAPPGTKGQEMKSRLRGLSRGRLKMSRLGRPRFSLSKRPL